jgi:hypothetical protein
VGSTWQLRCLRAASEEEASSDDGGEDEPAPLPEPQGEDERDESESSEEEEADVDDDDEDEALGVVQPQEQAHNHNDEGTTKCNPGGITYPLAKPAPEAPEDHGPYQVHSGSGCPALPSSHTQVIATLHPSRCSSATSSMVPCQAMRRTTGKLSSRRAQRGRTQMRNSSRSPC